MKEEEYQSIQNQLKKKLHGPPPSEYKGSSNREEGYRKGLLTAMSVLSSWYKYDNNEIREDTANDN